MTRSRGVAWRLPRCVGLGGVIAGLPVCLTFTPVYASGCHGCRWGRGVEGLGYGHAMP
ncbi:uncharacterized protein BO72DRAFT_446144 [Aspergillus fijiensis CBS 313.89]|uniref:Uncharacterized protein n=1 Tax=Aspergillus fijiensis CBS 313.89 TaxID=1448319 RepID=A0A8G1RU65_9EURO|nr:uncharacterized protein BO72DRAFT_446144 [Aspergillus fijiensis CBS 313.89]RAK79314.1 hypothetical protein BO72DRAFT_446144 [Aspergillus fijiensis CBS 313.89]